MRTAACLRVEDLQLFLNVFLYLSAGDVSWMSYFQAHLFRKEQSLVHRPEFIGYDRGEFHERQDIFFDIYTGGDLDQREALAGKFEYRTFRNIENVLVSLFDGIFTGECDMFDILFEFDIFAFPDYIDAAVFNIYLAFSSCERAKEAYRLGALGYIYEPSGSRHFACKF